MDALGIWLKSPLAVSMLVSRHLFDTVVVTPESAPDRLEQFASMPSQPGRLKVGVVASAQVLRNKAIRAALAKLDRMIIIDSPDMLAAMGVRLINLNYSSRGRWTPVQIDVDSLAHHLQVPQDLTGLTHSFKIPRLGSDAASRLTSAHLCKSLPKMATTSPEAEPSDIVAYIRLMCRYAAGLVSAGDMREATKTVVSAGGNPTITPRLARYLKNNRDNIKKAAVLHAKYRIAGRELAKHFEDPLLDQEIEFIFANLGSEDIETLSKVKKSLPPTMRGTIGTDLEKTTQARKKDGLVDLIRQELGGGFRVNIVAVTKLRKRLSGGQKL
jgi:hypothetical protein